MFQMTLGSPDIASMMSGMTKKIKQSRGQNVFAQPTGPTFLRLIKCAVERLQFGDIEKGRIVSDLIAAMSQSGFMMQSNFNQENYLWGTMLGLLPIKTMTSLASDNLRSFGCTSTSPGSQFFGVNPPIILSVTLLVPREVMRDVDKDANCPMFEMGVMSQAFDNRFTAIHSSPVKKMSSSEYSTDTPTHENILNLHHFSIKFCSENDYEFIAFSTLIPQYMLCLLAPEDINIAILLTSDAYVNLPMSIKSKYGIRRIVHSSSLSNTEVVSWTASDHCLPHDPGTPISAITTDMLTVSPFTPTVTNTGSIESVTCTVQSTDVGLVSQSSVSFVPDTHPLKGRFILGSHIIDIPVPPIYDVQIVEFK
eukprot:CAMPEP_0182433062 /NCGR_PEP_ID=MMETSP1167-20130531/60567_1 /TAXON_ID=2988 /ORGANISM="Mallomonas Sp, Strain CCMP3275" /LENGTH=364 /DNA_ID=CAMNT_0024621269 /DNA_START=1 /DNA_END=1096 /DNA_ORIENTATION=+